MIEIRQEAPVHHEAVRALNDRAFGQPQEGRIVDALRAACPEAVSMVALSGKTVVGHIFFSPVVIDAPDAPGAPGGGMGLAPMAVLPEFQRQGIGTRMVENGIQILTAAGCPFIIVLGHETYYPRFGFAPASRHALRAQWEGVPDEAFMVLVLDAAAINGVTGVARYHEAFDTAM